MNGLVEVVVNGRGSYGCSAIAISGSGKAGEMLADFVDSDLQGSVRSTEMVIDRINEVRTGKQASWVRNGNGYLLKILPDRAILQDLYPPANSEDTVTVGLSHLEDAVRQWAEALKSLEKRPSR